MTSTVISSELTYTLQVQVVASEEKYAWILAVQTALNPKENHGLKAVSAELRGSSARSTGGRTYYFDFEVSK